MPEAAYDDAFMSYTAGASAHAAGEITRMLAKNLMVQSTLDVGCALGTWVAAWRAAGVSQAFGVDGDYVSRDALQIPATNFRAHDLGRPFDLGEKFDLTQSLEVGEHIAPEQTDIFVDNILRHAGRFILFSAAPPGQGGENHVNERPYSDWKARFEAAGFRCYDAIRPAIAADSKIAFWYRYNVFLYVREGAEAALPASWAKTRLPAGIEPVDVAPPWFKARKFVVRRLPASAQNFLARMKASLRSG